MRASVRVLMRAKLKLRAIPRLPWGLKFAIYPLLQTYSSFYLGVRAACNRRNAAYEVQRIRSSASSTTHSPPVTTSCRRVWTISRRRCVLIRAAAAALVVLASCFAGCSVVVRSIKSSFSGAET